MRVGERAAVCCVTMYAVCACTHGLLDVLPMECARIPGPEPDTNWVGLTVG